MNFIETIFSNLEKNESRPFVIEMHKEREHPTSGAKLLEHIAKVRGFLRASSVSPGDRVALIAPNSARWVACDLAMLAEGLITVPLYARQATHELVKMMKDAGATLVICATREIADAVGAEWPEAKTATFEAVFAAAPINEKPLARNGSDVVTLVYTSGTSGDAKGAMITTSNVDAMLPMTRGALSQMMGAGAASSERVFHYLPFCFMGSRIVLWTCLYRGVPIYASTNLDDLALEMKGANPHYFLNVPALLERIRKGVEAKLQAKPKAVVALYERGKAAYARRREGKPAALDGVTLALAKRLVFSKIREQLGSNLRCLICGSAPLHPDTQRWFEMIGVPVYQVYGLTETTAIVTMDVPPHVIAGRVGKAIEVSQMLVGENDELLVKGPHIFAGYWGREEATRSVFTNGYFRTGDQCEIDEHGNLKIVGRVNAMLVPESGHNVAPEPIEEEISARLGGAEHVVVIGHGRSHLTAIVTGKVEQAAVARAIEEINSTLPHYKRIRKFHVAAESLTPENGMLTANQKLKRRAIEKHFDTAISEMYS